MQPSTICNICLRSKYLITPPSFTSKAPAFLRTNRQVPSAFQITRQIHGKASWIQAQRKFPDMRVRSLFGFSKRDRVETIYYFYGFKIWKGRSKPYCETEEGEEDRRYYDNNDTVFWMAAAFCIGAGRANEKSKQEEETDDGGEHSGRVEGDCVGECVGEEEKEYIDKSSGVGEESSVTEVVD